MNFANEECSSFFIPLTFEAHIVFTSYDHVTVFQWTLKSQSIFCHKKAIVSLNRHKNGEYELHNCKPSISVT